MATVYKTLTNNDTTSTRTLLNEAIPITGTIVSGTYGAAGALGSEPNIKTYSHGMFESVYDYPYLSSSANHIFDITTGYASDSALSASSNSQNTKKINIYNQMAQVLAGYDQTGSIRQFDKDGNLTGGTKSLECFFLNFSRLLVKDEIKKGSFSLELGVNSAYEQAGAVFTKRIKLTDTSGSNGYFVNSPAGEYGVLFASSSTGTALIDGETLGNPETNPACGLIYYQAGVAVISGSVFNDAAEGGILHNSNAGTSVMTSTSAATGFQFVTGSTIAVVADQIRNRIYNVSFNNTVELNSTVYFCRANHNEFNYSSNPTYISGSRIQVKNNPTDTPVSYITTVGLYSADNELLAVAKLSEPLKKDPTNEITLRVRLDY